MQTHPWEPWDLLQVLGEGGMWLSGFHVIRRFYDAVARLETGILFRDDAIGLARILAATPDLALQDGLVADPGGDNGPRSGAVFLSGSTGTWLCAGSAAAPAVSRMHRNTRETLLRYYEMGMLDRPPPEAGGPRGPFDFATEEERATYDG